MRKHSNSILKLFLVSFILTIGLLILTSCGGDKISTPSTLQINDSGVLTWLPVEGAEKFIINVNGTDYETKSTNYDLSKLNLTPGTYQVKVKAISGSEKNNSNFSTTISYVVVEVLGRLSTPTNVRVENGLLLWSSVANATSYEVKVGAVTKTVMSNQIALSEYGTIESKVVITIKAISGGAYLSSELSSPLNFIGELSLSGLKTAIVDVLVTKFGFLEAQAVDEAESYIDGYLLPLKEWADLSYNDLFYLFDTVSLLEGTRSVIGILDNVLKGDFSNQKIAQIIRALLIEWLPNTFVSSSETLYYEEHLATTKAELIRIESNIEAYRIDYETKKAAYLASNYYYAETEISKKHQQIDEIYERFTDYYNKNASLFTNMSYWDYEILINNYKYNLMYDYPVNDMLNQLPWLNDLTQQCQNLNILSSEVNALYDIIYLDQEAIAIHNDYDYAMRRYNYEMESKKSYERTIQFYEYRLQEIEASIIVQENVLNYIKENKSKVIDGLIPIVKLVRHSYIDNINMIIALMELKNLTPTEMNLYRNELVESLFDNNALPTQQELTATLILFEDLSNLYLEPCIETLDEPHKGLYQSIKDSIPFVSQYLLKIYPNYKTILKEFLLSAEISDFEAILGLENKEELLTFLLSFSDRFVNNTNYQQSVKAIDNLTSDLILSGNLKFFPYLISKTLNIPIDLSKDIYQIITTNNSLIKQAFDEVVSIYNGAFLDYFIEFLNGNNQIKSGLKFINWQYLKTINGEDIDDFVAVLKMVLVKVYPYVNTDPTLLPEEIADLIQESNLTELITKTVQLFADYMMLVDDFDEQNKLNNLDYQVIIEIAQALSGFYTVENQEKIERIIELLEVIVHNYNFLNLSESALNNLSQNLNKMFERAELYRTYDYNDLTEEQKVLLNDFIMIDLPIFSQVIDYNREVKLRESIVNLETAFSSFVKQGKYCALYISDETFILEEVFEKVGWTNYEIYKDSYSPWIEFYVTLSFDDTTYTVNGYVNETSIYTKYYRSYW